jgi:hypothetical protein
MTMHPPHTSLKTTEFVINNMVIVTHPPYLLDLTHDFALLPKFKIKLKGRCFEKCLDIQRELQVVLNNITENGFHGF